MNRIMGGFALAGLFVSLAGGSSAWAGFISIQTDLSVTREENRASVEVKVTNQGDEAAHNFQVTVEVGGEVKKSAMKDQLGVKETITELMEFELNFSKPGMYPVLVSVDYTDANRYPFTAISIGELNFQERVLGRVAGEVLVDPFSKRGKARVMVKNLEKEEKRFDLRLFLPKEFSTGQDSRSVTVPPGGEESVDFDIENISALQDSSYQIFSLITFSDETYHYMHNLSGTAQIIPFQSFVGRYYLVFVAVAFVLLVFVVSLNLRKRKRQSTLP